MKLKLGINGAATALITPFSGSRVDYDSFERIIDYQISEGISAIVVCGTTGEAATLTEREQMECIAYAADRAAGRVKVIAGTGSNSTERAVRLSRYACDAGADGLLVVTPYYNKASQRGLVEHYTAISKASSKPIIIYNVPSRTGVNISPQICLELCRQDNISAIKEASGDISRVCAIRALCGDSLDIYSGNDDMIVPVMSVGGKGVVSVMSNIIPKRIESLCRVCTCGYISRAASEQLALRGLNDALFCEVNPIPVKYAMHLLGFCSDELRLPLCPADEAVKLKVGTALKELGLI